MVLGKKAAVAPLHWLCPYLTTGVLHSILIASEVAQCVGCGTTTDTAFLPRFLEERHETTVSAVLRLVQCDTESALYTQ